MALAYFICINPYPGAPMPGGAWAVNSKLGPGNATVTSETPFLSLGQAIFSDSYERNAHYASFLATVTSETPDVWWSLGRKL